VPIRDFLKSDGFGPEAISSMSGAMTDVLAALGLKDKPDELNIVVAKRIIERAEVGRARSRAALSRCPQELAALTPFSESEAAVLDPFGSGAGRSPDLEPRTAAAVLVGHGRGIQRRVSERQPVRIAPEPAGLNPCSP
jgi:hypothetical protein